jgi:hypothetical protein
MVRDAIRRRASFNVVHLESMTKVDVFIRKDGEYDHEVSPSASGSTCVEALLDRALVEAR